MLNIGHKPLPPRLKGASVSNMPPAFWEDTEVRHEGENAGGCRPFAGAPASVIRFAAWFAMVCASAWLFSHLVGAARFYIFGGPW